MRLPVTYVWTHDSIGLGEDGPTHQPVEHLAALRAIPGLDVVRPADANETAVAWRTILEQHRPPGRPAPDPAEPRRRSTAPSTRTAEGAAKGAYVLAEAASGTPHGDPHRDRLRGADRAGGPRAARGRGHPDPGGLHALPGVVRRAGRGLPADGAAADVKARVCVEAGVAHGWRDIVGDAGECISLEHFGASAPYQILYEQFGITPDRVVAAAHASLSQGRGDHRRAPPATEPTATRPTASRPHHEVTGKELPHERPPAQLSAAGVAVWLDDLSRERLATGNLADADPRPHVVGVTTNPTIFQKAITRATTVRRAGPRPRGPRRRRSARRCARSPPTTCAAPATSCARSTTPATASTAGCPSRSTRGSRTTTERRSPRPARCGGWSTGRTCSSRSRRPSRACRRSARRCPRASASTSR